MAQLDPNTKNKNQDDRNETNENNENFNNNNLENNQISEEEKILENINKFENEKNKTSNNLEYKYAPTDINQNYYAQQSLNNTYDVNNYNLYDYNDQSNYDLYYQSLYQMYPQMSDVMKKNLFYFIYIFSVLQKSTRKEFPTA